MNLDNSLTHLMLSAQLDVLKKDNVALRKMQHEITEGKESRMGVAYTGMDFEVSDSDQELLRSIQLRHNISDLQLHELKQSVLKDKVRKLGKACVLSPEQTAVFIEMIITNNNSEITKLEKELSALLAKMQATTEA